MDFDGTGAITVTAAAGTLSGSTLKSTVTASSLTSVGTLSSLSIANGGTIGSVGDSDAITLSTAGNVTLAEVVTTSKGVKFPATQVSSTDANTLDDYEEGTFTPVISFGGGTTGISYGTQEGFYTKVGRLCFASFRCTLTSKGSSTGAANVTLPFTAANINQPGAEPLNYGAAFGMEENEITVGANKNAASAVFFQTDGGSTLTDSLFRDNSDFQVSLVFMTT